MGLRRRSRFSVAIAGAKVGFELSLACDFRLVSETCLYALPEQRRGQIPGSDGAARLQKMIGITRAKDIATRSRRPTRPPTPARRPGTRRQRRTTACAPRVPHTLLQ